MNEYTCRFQQKSHQFSDLGQILEIASTMALSSQRLLMPPEVKPGYVSLGDEWVYRW